MFGYVIVNKPEMKFKDFDVYRSFYCGLCRELKRKYGVSGQIKKVSNTDEKVSNEFEKVSNTNEKISNGFEKYIPALEYEKITDKYIKNIKLIYDRYGEDFPFRQSDIQEALNCSKSKSTNLMNAMKTAGILKKVEGLGKGKYRFIKSDEMY